MTRKDFINASHLVKASLALRTLTHAQAEDIVKFLCVFFQESNPNFKHSTFIKACGLEIVRAGSIDNGSKNHAK